MFDAKIAKREVRLLYILMISLMGLGAYSVYNTNNQAYLACKRVQTLQTYALQTIQRSEKTLPTIAYYKNPDHHAELVHQLSELKKAEKGFTPIPCTRKII